MCVCLMSIWLLNAELLVTSHALVNLYVCVREILKDVIQDVHTDYASVVVV